LLKQQGVFLRFAKSICPGRFHTKVESQTRPSANRFRQPREQLPLWFRWKKINLHHMTQTQDGAIAEIAQTFHQKNSATIHVNTSDVPSGINRSQFDKWRKQYWENRANDF
ncbi:HNH/ENDO VII family nuclease, partial [Rhodospirillum sp. A1_3_36]|uniref:HNH/ENDO VII family nuclease n=1 Tax=Rhodospirillum sp. A1_3_36 TaxID=3391666 RepID=UPI0039A75372